MTPSRLMHYYRLLKRRLRDGVNIFFLGNCQTNAMCGILKDCSKSSSRVYGRFNSITEFFGKYDEAQIDANLESADLVVGMCVSNPEHRYSAAKLRNMLGSRLILMPYVYIDGIASLESVASKGQTIVRGAEYLSKHPAWPSTPAVLTAFARGEIDMAQCDRLERSIARIEAAEQEFCDIRISDHIRAIYTEKPILYAMNHPTQHVLFEMFHRLVDFLGLKPDMDLLHDPLTWEKRALPVAHRSFTPQDVSVLSLGYAHSPHWYGQAWRLIRWAVNKSAREPRIAGPQGAL